jgi:protein CpxP
MNSNLIKNIVIVVLVVVNAGCLFFLWQTKMHHPRGPHGDRGPKNFIIKELKLDDKQQAAYMDLIKEHRAQMKEGQECMRTYRDSLVSLMLTNDTAGVNYYTHRLGECQKTIELSTFSHFQKLGGLCNAEQKAKLVKTIQEGVKMMGPPPPGGGPGGEHGPPPPKE